MLQYLDLGYSKIDPVLEIHYEIAYFQRTELWTGETATASASWQENTTNTFVSSCWYADNMEDIQRGLVLMVYWREINKNQILLFKLQNCFMIWLRIIFNVTGIRDD